MLMEPKHHNFVHKILRLQTLSRKIDTQAKEAVNILNKEHYQMNKFLIFN